MKQTHRFSSRLTCSLSFFISTWNELITTKSLTILQHDSFALIQNTTTLFSEYHCLPKPFTSGAQAGSKAPFRLPAPSPLALTVAQHLTYAIVIICLLFIHPTRTLASCPKQSRNKVLFTLKKSPAFGLKYLLLHE